MGDTSKAVRIIVWKLANTSHYNFWRRGVQRTVTYDSCSVWVQNSKGRSESFENEEQRRIRQQNREEVEGMEITVQSGAL
jgi:hypothetical protein